MNIRDKWDRQPEQFKSSQKEAKEGKLHSLLSYYQCMKHDTMQSQQRIAMFHRGIKVIGWGNRLLQLTN